MLKEPYNRKNGTGRSSGYDRPAAPPMKNLLTEVNSLLYHHNVEQTKYMAMCSLFSSKVCLTLRQEG